MYQIHGSQKSWDYTMARKIKKCDPKRLEVTRHACHDKTFLCYFLQHDTKTNWWNSLLHRGVIRSESVCGKVLSFCLIRCVPALTYWRDPIRNIHSRSPVPRLNGLDCLTVSFSQSLCVPVCNTATAVWWKTWDQAGSPCGRKSLTFDVGLL